MDNRVHSESRMVCLGMLKKMTLEHIKELMKAGDVKVAAEELKKLLAAEPDNAEAKMLYGTCCHLFGDDKTFAKIHDELAPMMDSEKAEKTLSLWHKYQCLVVATIFDVRYAKAGVALMECLVFAGLIIAALVVAIWLFGGEIRNNFLYGGPPYMKLEIERAEQVDREEMIKTLYAGPGYSERESVPANIHSTDNEAATDL